MHIFLWTVLGIFFHASYVAGNGPCVTGHAYDMLGCFEENDPGTAIFSDRHNINWKDIVGYMRRLACKCSNAAKEKGFAGFAMHYWGVCYGRTAEELKSVSSHKEKKCVGDQAYEKCDIENHEHCTGRDYAEAVYKFKVAGEGNVDGGLSEWQQWTKCDKKCGNGFKKRERTCDNPEPKGKGKDCSKLGALTEAKPCKVKDCPVNGGYSDWSAYKPCTKSCGGGTQTKSRECNNPKPAHGGKNCEGESSKTVPCNIQPCPVNGGYSNWGVFKPCTKSCGGGTKTRTRICDSPRPAHGGKECSDPPAQIVACNTHLCPINGGYSNWGAYKPCTKSCGGGTKTRSRECNNPISANGGKNCAGASSHTMPCNSSPCPANGGYGDWGAYKPCTKSCGGGTKTRSRECNNPRPANGGKNCEGASSHTVQCNSNPCPVNGGYGNWGGYKPCTKSCGGGTKTRSRKCNNPTPANGGKNCAGASSHTVPCNSNPCPVNGGYGNWGAYKPCTKPCGGGTKTRHRTCNNPSPAHGGKNCVGASSQSVACNTNACHTQIFTVGHLIKSTWRFESYNYRNYFFRHQSYRVRLDKFVANNQLYDLDSSWIVVAGLCGQGISFKSENYPTHYLRHRGYMAYIDRFDSSALFRKDACFIPRHGLAHSLFVSFESVNYPGYYLRHQNYFLRISRNDGSTLMKKDATWIPRDIRVHGRWSSFGAYGSCSKPCGGGVKYRRRTCTNPKPSHGGRSCLGSSSQSAACNAHACPVNGGYSNWGAYKPCTKSCGGGTKTRYRTCNNPRPANGGRNCVGASSHTVQCNTNACPSTIHSVARLTTSTWRFESYNYRNYFFRHQNYRVRIDKFVANNQLYNLDSSWIVVAGLCVQGVSFKSENYPTHYLRHRGYMAYIDRFDGSALYRKDACFMPRAGLADGRQVSFESVNYPGYFLRHQNYFLRISRNDGSTLMKKDATWIPRDIRVNGGWSGYGGYGACNKKCGGGVRYRYRSCTNPKPAHGGRSCSGLTWLSSSCNSQLCPAISGCSFYSTTWSTHRGGKMEYIDRHRMGCSGMGKILAMFQLRRSGGNMRYSYKCCSFAASSTCTNQRKYTGFSYDGNGNAVYLDRHAADCGTTGFISDIRVERNSYHNKVRYNYQCCNLASQWRGSTSCYTSTTGYTSDGNGLVYYLDRQKVECRRDYALSYYKLERNSRHNQWRYRYRCCKVNY